MPPVPRAAERDFDPGAKYHVPGNTPYTRYFLARILQFQFYKAACDRPAGRARCTAAPSTATRKSASGSTRCWRWARRKPWPDALEAFTGSREMSGEPMVEYFAPLLAWLQEQNAGKQCGW